MEHLHKQAQVGHIPAHLEQGPNTYINLAFDPRVTEPAQPGDAITAVISPITASDTQLGEHDDPAYTDNEFEYTPMNPIDVDAWFTAYGMAKPDNTDNTAIESPLIVSDINNAPANTAAAPDIMCQLLVTDEFEYTDSDTACADYTSD